MVQPDEQQTANADRAGQLRKELFGLVRDERAVRREIGERVLKLQPVDDLRAHRSELRERQEDLSAAVVQLEAATP